MLEDAARALRLVRSKAPEMGFDPNKIVVIGSSAGGHLAATLLTKWDSGQLEHSDPVERKSSRPDLGVLCYPVISMREWPHEGSRVNLLGHNPSEEALSELSAELHVRPDTAPCFVWHTREDETVFVHNALVFVQALHTQKVPFESPCCEHGGHGLGMKDKSPLVGDCVRWLRRRLLKAPGK